MILSKLHLASALPLVADLIISTTLYYPPWWHVFSLISLFRFSYDFQMCHFPSYPSRFSWSIQTDIKIQDNGHCFCLIYLGDENVGLLVTFWYPRVYVCLYLCRERSEQETLFPNHSTNCLFVFFQFFFFFALLYLLYQSFRVSINDTRYSIIVFSSISY